MIEAIIVLLYIFEILVFSSMMAKFIKQKEVVDIKNTKYFFPTILVNLFVYLVAMFGFGATTGEGIFLDISTCIAKSLSACFLNVDANIISPAIEQSVMFTVAFVLSYILNLFTLLFVLVGLLGRYFINFIKVTYILHNKKEKFIIFGHNDDAVDFSKSVPSKNVIFWVGNIDKAEKKKLLTKKSMNLYFEKLDEKAVNKFKNAKVHFVSFETDNEKVINIINIFNLIENKNFNLHIAIDNQYEEAFKYNYYHNSVNFFNKYSLMSQKFLADHPITKYLNNQQIDTTTATVKQDVDLNIFLFGYGAPNKNLFPKLVIDNQFATIQDGTRRRKKVKYHIFDKEDFKDKNYTANFDRYVNATYDKSQYFDLPHKPMEMTYYREDFFTSSFFNTLDSVVDKVSRENSLTYVIVSFGSDLDNYDETIRLKRYFAQKGLEHQILFFCRITQDTYIHLLEETGIIPFGEFDIMDYDTIICEKLNKLSVERNFQQCLKEPEVVEAIVQINKISSIKKQQEELNKLKLGLWNSLDVYTRDFNIYNSINIRTKLNLCGFDVEGEEEVSNKEYYKVYDALNEMIVVSREKVYTYPYPESFSARNMLAYQEHLHSNAFWFMKGFAPMRKDDFCNNPKLTLCKYKKKQLITLTSCDGLDEIILWLKELRDTGDARCANIEYDLKKPLYQVMDNVPLYKYSVYKIYKKQ